MSNKSGRKLQLNTETKNQIYDWICDGQTIKTIARKLSIARNTIYRWMKKDNDFKNMVKEAREIQAGTFIDDCIDIADDTSKDLIIDPETGREYPNAAAVARAKLKISTRKKVAGYYNPQVYGDKAQLDVVSSDGTGFKGLVITPPKPEEDEEDVDKE